MKLSVLMTESEMIILRQIAARNCRRPQDQARWIIVEALKQYTKEVENQELKAQDESIDGPLVG